MNSDQGKSRESVLEAEVAELRLKLDEARAECERMRAEHTSTQSRLARAVQQHESSDYARGVLRQDVAFLARQLEQERGTSDRMRAVVGAARAVDDDLRDVCLAMASEVTLPRKQIERLYRMREALNNLKDSRGGVGGEVPSGGTPGWSPGGAGSNPVVTTPAPGSLREAAESVLDAIHDHLWRVSGHHHWDHTMRAGAGCEKCAEIRDACKRIESATHDLRAALAAEPDCPPAASAVDRTYQEGGGAGSKLCINCNGTGLRGFGVSGRGPCPACTGTGKPAAEPEPAAGEEG